MSDLHTQQMADSHGCFFYDLCRHCFLNCFESLPSEVFPSDSNMEDDVALLPKNLGIQAISIVILHFRPLTLTLPQSAPRVDEQAL